ncbi:MAG: preprotein translocase subunit SecE [Bacteroidota bacterium]
MIAQIPQIMNKLIAYVKESREELLRKVSWPTWEQLQDSLMVVLIASLLFSLLIYLMDVGFSSLLSAFYHLFQ